MKKLLILSLSILLVINSNAQIATTNYRSKIENIFQHIDKSQISTSLLSEYGLDFIKLDGFTIIDIAFKSQHPPSCNFYAQIYYSKKILKYETYYNFYSNYYNNIL